GLGKSDFAADLVSNFLEGLDDGRGNLRDANQHRAERALDDLADFTLLEGKSCLADCRVSNAFLLKGAEQRVLQCLALGGDDVLERGTGADLVERRLCRILVGENDLLDRALL